LQSPSYIAPQVRDYGTLVELTAAVDINLVGAAGNLVMAAMSAPIAPGGAVEGQVGGGGVGHGGALNLAEPGGGGRLPFTGLSALLVAGVGAALASVGAALRALIAGRRRATAADPARGRARRS